MYEVRIEQTGDVAECLTARSAALAVTTLAHDAVENGLPYRKLRAIVTKDGEHVVSGLPHRVAERLVEKRPSRTVQPRG